MPFLKLRVAPLLVALWLAILPLQASAQEESAVRAAMIFNLLKFTTWPTSVAADAPLRICLINASKMLNDAMKTLDQRMIGKHELNILINPADKGAASCEVVASDATEDDAYDPAKFSRPGLLTIGSNHFIDRGGMIGIVNIDNRLRLEINVTAMQDADIAMSAKVLQLALRTR